MWTDGGHRTYTYVSWQRAHSLHLYQLTEDIQLTFTSADRGHTTYIYISWQRAYSLHLLQLTEGIQLTFISADRAYGLRLCQLKGAYGLYSYHLTECINAYIYISWGEIVQLTFISTDRGQTAYVYASWQREYSLNTCQVTEGIKLTFISPDRGHIG
jgi:hypothetical protein